jgi:carboxylesterase type B
MNYFFLTLVLLLINSESLNASYARCSHNDTGKFILETNSGKIKGNCQHVVLHTDTHQLGENVYSWLSIPFAEPPIGENRFEAPKPIRPWSNILDGTKWPNSCVQNIDESLSSLKPEEQFSAYKMWIPSRKYTNFSEDCLYLNLFLPAETYLRSSLTSKKDPAPIVVFIHGTSGTPVLDIYDPSNFVAISGLIAVTITYRTGILGNLFLDGELGGNQALLDQHLALKWVQSNAEKFGGDPTRITLLGSSAGAASIGYHLLYRPSWPLFRNVILQAGSPFINSAKPISSDEATNRGRGFLHAIGCGNMSSSNAELLACARQHNAHYLTKQVQVYLINHLLDGSAVASGLSVAFPPVIDGEVVKETPEEAFKSNNFKSCSILNGFSANEGSMFVAYAGLMGTKSMELRKQVPINFNKIYEFVSEYLKFYPSYPHRSTKAVIDAIIFQYTKLTSEFHNQLDAPLTKLNYFNALSRIIGDQIFVCPAVKLMDFYARRNHSVYSYLYSHRISSSPWPSWYGVVHADELAMVMGQPLAIRAQNTAISTNPWLSPKAGYPRREKTLSKEIILYWSNFVKFDNPNVQDKDTGDDEELKEWPLYKVSSQNLADNNQYLVLRSNGSKAARSYGFEECQFWNHLIPALIDELGKLLFFKSERIMSVG